MAEAARNIVLIGFPGVGKSSIGRLVAEKLGLAFVDTDEEITKREQRPITKIFRESGEPYFREAERRIIEESSGRSGTVISTGGGCVMDERNITALKRHSLLFYLSATPEALYDRLKEQEDRPLLLGRSRWELAEQIRNLMKRRAFQYIQTRNVIDVTCLTREAAADRIARIYRGEFSIKLVGLIGSNLEKSLSPLMHNAAFHHQRLNYHYQCMETEDLPAVVTRAKQLEMTGFNVTFPYKEAIMPFLDELTPAARMIGAVNTVTNRGNLLIGDNTDVAGAMTHLAASIKRRLPLYALPGKRAAVLGAGGAARALVVGLQQAGCEVIILGRNAAKAQELAAHFGIKAAAIEELSGLNPEIIVNATTVGMGDTVNQSLAPVEMLRPEQVIFDIVYYPVRTQLLKDAAKAGAVTVDGVGMLVRQGALSYQQWTGRKAPRYLMERVVRKFLQHYPQADAGREIA